ncbi:MAG: helix-turn-helix domain-containing protein [Albidovulum sp.]
MNRALLEPSGTTRPIAWPRGIRPQTGHVAFPRRIRQGQPLFHEGDRASFVYEIARGVVRSTRLQTDGRRQVMGFGFPGDVVGLPAAGRHTTECEAITDCDVFVHRVENLAEPTRDLLLHQFLTEAALREIRSLQDHFLLLGAKLALERTAAFLMLVLDRIGETSGGRHRIHLPMNRTDIADYLGLTPETVSRSFTELRARQVIALEDACTVIVLSAEALRALSGNPADARQGAWPAGQPAR